MDKVELRCWQEKANLLAQQIKKGRSHKEIYFEAINGHYRFVGPRDKVPTVGEEKRKIIGMILRNTRKTVLSVKPGQNPP